MKDQQVNRIIMVIIIGIGVAIISALAAGCSTLGNGKVDPFGIELSLEYHDNFGNGFVFVGGELTEATYQSTQTGILYKYTDEAAGSFMVAAPDGKTKIRLRKKTAAECWTL